MYPERDRNRGIRYFLFLMFICIGFAGGWYYARVLKPAEFINTTPEYLRRDYQTDFVLMVAEAYSGIEDQNYALCQIGLLGISDPIEVMTKAMSYGSSLGYPAEDLAIIGELKDSLDEMQFDVEDCN